MHHDVEGRRARGDEGWGVVVRSGHVCARLPRARRRAPDLAPRADVPGRRSSQAAGEGAVPRRAWGCQAMRPGTRAAVPTRPMRSPGSRECTRGGLWVKGERANAWRCEEQGKGRQRRTREGRQRRTAEEDSRERQRKRRTAKDSTEGQHRRTAQKDSTEGHRRTQKDNVNVRAKNFRRLRLESDSQSPIESDRVRQQQTLSDHRPRGPRREKGLEGRKEESGRAAAAGTRSKCCEKENEKQVLREGEQVLL